MIKKRVGIFGGTFNPPHVGHVRAAEAFAEQMKLDKLLIIPDYIPPHKDYVGNVSANDRLKMCEIAFGNINNTVISDMEISRGGRSYTYITLQELKSDEYDLYMLVGTDMFLTLDSWVNPDIIFDIADVCYVRRESDSDKTKNIKEKTEQYINKFKARIHSIDASATEISSTELRQGIIDGSADGLITMSVMEYIKSEGLYNG